MCRPRRLPSARARRAKRAPLSRCARQSVSRCAVEPPASHRGTAGRTARHAAGHGRFSFPRRPTPARAAAHAIARPPGCAAGTRAIR
ncbi:hypothetical protein C6Q28_33320 [Burkholderia multivorans]|nr:hypothetical protein C6Q28_33320 [Burkholderia multivorans]RSB73439.1 hypothetical protein EGT33_20060 [Burkholderia multivorans]